VQCCYDPGRVTLSAVQHLDPVGRIGRYEILGRLAMGGMAEIFLARESGPHAASRELVVKRVLPHVAANPSLMEMFINEARLVMRLRHPSICPIYEFGEDDDGSFYIAMEWVHGVSLARLMKKAGERGGLPVPFAVKIASDLAGALHHAHMARGPDGAPLQIVHRDVTPENVMISYDGVARLLDFGIAKAATQLDKTQAGVLKGKFAYMSPEQYQGEPLDGRSDVFSLGVCLYEALTGVPLYARGNEYETVAAIILDPRVPSIRDVEPNLPAELDAIVKRALAKRPEQRFQSADEMQAALFRFQSWSGEVAREVDIERYLGVLFGDEQHRMPDLERSQVQIRRAAKSEPPIRGIDKLALDAHLDDVEEELEAARRRKTLAVALIAILIVLGVLGAAALAIKGGGFGGGSGATDGAGSEGPG
jgi:serine/threonine-protein kinase